MSSLVKVTAAEDRLEQFENEELRNAAGDKSRSSLVVTEEEISVPPHQPLPGEEPASSDHPSNQPCDRPIEGDSSEVPKERRASSSSTRAWLKRAAATKGWDSDMSDNVESMITHADTLNWMLKQLAPQRSGSEPAVDEEQILDREIARPELERMSWSQWLVAAGKGTRPHHAAIDVLIGEPKVQSTASRRFQHLLDRQRSSNPENLADPAMLDKRPPLPARIRINSVPAKRIVDGFCNDEMRFAGETNPLIIQRPYKVLAWHEDGIRDRLKELRQFLAAREAKERDQPDTREPTELRARKFPQDSIFFTGTDWDILTVAEVKEAMDDFACVVQFMDIFLTPIHRRLRDNPTEIHFHDLWHLFHVHKYIYVKETPQKIWRVIQATGGRKYLFPPDYDEYKLKNWQDKYSPFTIDCYYLDYDGAHIVPVFGRFTIDKYDDSIHIVSLPVIPIAVADVDTEVLRARGREFLMYTTSTTSRHRSYRGWTLSHNPKGQDLVKPIPDTTFVQRIFSERIESQVIIDFERAIQANPEWNPHGSELRLYRADDAECEDLIERFDLDSVWDAKHSEDLLELERKSWQSWEREGTLPQGDHLLLLPNRVFAYVLRTRTWACLQIASTEKRKGQLMEIKTREQPWKDLEIPSTHRSIVQALIRTHFATDNSSDAQFDLVQNKGKGVIVLLHGVPGVGKTATAECVAESEKRPLLPITCGDLGLNLKEVEATLQTSFQLAQAWDCVMLLDEADIFLAERTNADIERNALVSVFLRILEYYEGILFLTTNRVGSFDEAFKSRIHMALYYPPLNLEQTVKIWENHIARIQKVPTEVICQKEQLLDYARTLFQMQSQKGNLESIGPVWNGRQIRNAFQSAVALARNEAALPKIIMVEIRHFAKVAEVSNEFNNYIWRVKKGRDDSYFAGHRGLRDDSYSGMNNGRTAMPDPRTANAFGGMPMMQTGPSAAFPGANSVANYPPGGYAMHPQTMGHGQLYAPGPGLGQPQMFPAQPATFQQQQVGGMQQPSQQYSQYSGAQQPSGQASNIPQGQEYQPQPQPQPRQQEQQQQQQQASTYGSNLGMGHAPSSNLPISQQQ